MKHKVWFRYWFQTFFSVSQSQILYSFFLLYVQIEDYQNILKLRQWSLSCTPYKAFLKKKKKRFWTILPHFQNSFSSEIFLMLYSINGLNFMGWLLLLLEILGNMRDITNFWIRLFYQAIFLHGQKSHDKNSNFLRMKRAFQMK